MGLDIFKEKGVPLEKQQFTRRDMVQAPRWATMSL